MFTGKLKEDNWTFTTFSANCSRCGQASESGDVYFSGLSRIEPEEKQVTDDSSENERNDGRAPEQADGNEAENEGKQSSLERVDYCSECWEKTDADLYSYWRTEVPEPEEEDDREPDRSTLAGVFRGLVQTETDNQSDQAPPSKNNEVELKPEDDEKKGLIYLLTLMLMRKGFLALENEERVEEQTILTVRVKGTQDEFYSVAEPDLQVEMMDRVKHRLAELLDMEPSDD